MKISREQKEKNRQALIKSAVDLMNKEGLRDVTMKRIAQSAGLSEPVIYKYFPTKDDLISAYFNDSLNEAIQKARAQSDFEELSFCEQLHLLVDSQIALFEKHKRFISESFQYLFLTNLAGSMPHLMAHRQQFLDCVNELLDAAIAAKEFEEPTLRAVVVELLWDLHLGVVYYWLRDDSRGNHRTLQLLDRTLRLLEDVLRSNLVNRALDIFYFLAREHFIKSMDHFITLSPAQKNLKTRFMKNGKKK